MLVTLNGDNYTPNTTHCMLKTGKKKAQAI